MFFHNKVKTLPSSPPTLCPGKSLAKDTSHLQMLIQLQSQQLAILELELELFAIEPRIVLVDNAVEVWADDNDVRRVVVL